MNQFQTVSRNGIEVVFDYENQDVLDWDIDEDQIGTVLMFLDETLQDETLVEYDEIRDMYHVEASSRFGFHGERITIDHGSEWYTDLETASIRDLVFKCIKAGQFEPVSYREHLDGFEWCFEDIFGD